MRVSHRSGPFANFERGDIVLQLGLVPLAILNFGSITSNRTFREENKNSFICTLNEVT